MYKKAANELIEVRRKSDNFMLGTYTNDAFGRRVLREYRDAAAGGYKTLRYVYDSWQIAAEYLWDGLSETFFARIHYGNGIDEPLAMMILDVNDVNGNFITNEYLPYAFHRDTLGTITHLTDGDGLIVERYECSPFGRTTVYTGTGPDGMWNTQDDEVGLSSRIGNNCIFQGREFDHETGLYCFRTRYYSPQHGRFVHRDQPGDWYDALNWGNGYCFVQAAPFFLVDPHGLRAPTPAEYERLRKLAEKAAETLAKMEAAARNGDKRTASEYRRVHWDILDTLVNYLFLIARARKGQAIAIPKDYFVYFPEEDPSQMPTTVNPPKPMEDVVFEKIVELQLLADRGGNDWAFAVMKALEDWYYNRAGRKDQIDVGTEKIDVTSEEKFNESLAKLKGKVF